MKLSIIDQSPVSEGSTPADALHNTIELAKLADRLGYERYWIAEHHGMVTLASPAPEILIARVAAETSHIRVGSGGVMLPHYSPMKVAETFRMLHALSPGPHRPRRRARAGRNRPRDLRADARSQAA